VRSRSRSRWATPCEPLARKHLQLLLPLAIDNKFSNDQYRAPLVLSTPGLYNVSTYIHFVSTSQPWYAGMYVLASVRIYMQVARRCSQCSHVATQFFRCPVQMHHAIGDSNHHDHAVLQLGITGIVVKDNRNMIGHFRVPSSFTGPTGSDASDVQ
jgi:hypothetical protein